MTDQQINTPASTPRASYDAFLVRFPSGFPESYSPEDLTDYVFLKIDEYIGTDLHEETLSEALTEDFGHISLASWGTAAPEARRSIRELMRQRGVFVRLQQGVSMASHIHSAIQAGFVPWPDDARRPNHNPRFCPYGPIQFAPVEINAVPTTTTEEPVTLAETAKLVEDAVARAFAAASHVTDTNPGNGNNGETTSVHQHETTTPHHQTEHNPQGKIPQSSGTGTRTAQTLDITGQERRGSIIEQTGQYTFRTTPAPNYRMTRNAPRRHFGLGSDQPRGLRGLRDQLTTPPARFIPRPDHDPHSGFGRGTPRITPRSSHTAPPALHTTPDENPNGDANGDITPNHGSNDNTNADVTEAIDTALQPHHISKQVETLMKSYYDRTEKFSGLDTDDFDSKLDNYERHLELHSVDKSVWVRAFPVMLCDMALIFYKMEIQPVYDLTQLPFEDLVEIFREKFNTPQRALRLADDWDNLTFNSVSTLFPNATFEDKAKYIVSRLTTLRLYLQDQVNDFMHKRKLLQIMRPFPIFQMARLEGNLSLDDLQTRLLWAVSDHASGPERSLASSTANITAQTTEEVHPMKMLLPTLLIECSFTVPETIPLLLITPPEDTSPHTTATHHTAPQLTPDITQILLARTLTAQRSAALSVRKSVVGRTVTVAGTDLKHCRTVAVLNRRERP